MTINPLIKDGPWKEYSGLTIILSEPSRHDTKRLITGNAGDFFWSSLYPYTRENCEVRVISCNDPIREGTKVILLLGDRSVSVYNGGYTLNELRGCPFKLREDGPTFIASYAPQDSFDRKNYDNDEEKDSEDKDDAGKGHGATQRKNWKFWLYQDLRKTIKILDKGLHLQPQYENIIYPASSDIIQVLRNTRDSYLYFDIETDRRFNLTCFGFCFLPKGNNNESVGKVEKVWVVPWKRYNNTLSYDDSILRRIIQALVIAFHLNNNTVVIHNSMFDLFVLAWKYKIPFPRSLHDTMIMWHRCYPEVEKSLGHLISYFTHEAYHKSEGTFDPKTQEQEQGLWKYNSKDVARMAIVHQKLLEECDRLGTTKSAIKSCRYVRPYLTMQFLGMKVDTEKLIKKYETLEFHAAQLIRCLKIVTGTNMNPRSSQQVSKYLYEGLGLECPNEDEPTNHKTLLKLLTKHNVPSVKIILAIRAKRKAASSLKFRLWGKNNDRFTTAYSVTGTDTYRLGSRALLKFKPDKGYGTNAQNVAKEMRDMVVPEYEEVS